MEKWENENGKWKMENENGVRNGKMKNGVKNVKNGVSHHFLVCPLFLKFALSQIFQLLF